MALKVYGWTGWRDECPRAANGNQQTREIVAAKSFAEASRLYGRKINRNRGSITGNEREVRLAMARPGIVLWRPLTDYKAPYLEAKP